VSEETAYNVAYEVCKIFLPNARKTVKCTETLAKIFIHGVARRDDVRRELREAGLSEEEIKRIEEEAERRIG